MKRQIADISHSLPNMEEAVKAGQMIIATLASKHADLISDLTTRWDGNVCSFGFNAKGEQVSGTMTVEANKFVVEADLPLLLNVFKGKISTALVVTADEVLNELAPPVAPETAPAGEAAAGKPAADAGAPAGAPTDQPANGEPGKSPATPPPPVPPAMKDFGNRRPSSPLIRPTPGQQPGRIDPAVLQRQVDALERKLEKLQAAGSVSKDDPVIAELFTTIEDLKKQLAAKASSGELKALQGEVTKLSEAVAKLPTSTDLKGMEKSLLEQIGGMIAGANKPAPAATTVVTERSSKPAKSGKDKLGKWWVMLVCFMIAFLAIVVLGIVLAAFVALKASAVGSVTTQVVLPPAPPAQNTTAVVKTDNEQFNRDLMLRLLQDKEERNYEPKAPNPPSQSEENPRPQKTGWTAPRSSDVPTTVIIHDVSTAEASSLPPPQTTYVYTAAPAPVYPGYCYVPRSYYDSYYDGGGLRLPLILPFGFHHGGGGGRHFGGGGGHGHGGHHR